MQALKTLIDRASDLCGGDAALARELNCSRSLVCLMKKGERAVTPEMAIILADMLNENVDIALRQAHIAATANSKNGYRIAQILGKAAAVGGVAMSAISYNGAANAYSVSPEQLSSGLNSLYIVSFRRMLKNWVQRYTKAKSLSLKAAI